MSQLKEGKASGLIMHKIDRSARNMRDWNLVMELPNHGVKPYFAADGLDFATRGGRLSANLQAVIAEDYIFNLREETIKGMNGRLKQGLYPWNAPPGYLNCGGGKPKVPCPKTAPLIKILFEFYASRQYSYLALLKEMHHRGLRNQRGGQLTLCGLGNILKNPFYIGLIFIKSSGQTYKGIHKPIIPCKCGNECKAFGPAGLDQKQPATTTCSKACFVAVFAKAHGARKAKRPRVLPAARLNSAPQRQCGRKFWILR